MSLWPLFDRYPHLAERFPHVALRRSVTPVEPLHEISPRLWVKRDDLTADPIGGNKVRSLELLLGRYGRGDRIVTAGARGSTHVLSTVVHAQRLGIAVESASWPQEMNETARAVDARLNVETARRAMSNPVFAALWLLWRGWHGAKVIPPGGTSPIGIIGHVNAGMELAQQVHAGVLPAPERVVVPLGTGGTAAGLVLGLRLGGLSTAVVGARVVPRIVGRRSRVRRLSRATLEVTGISIEDDFDIEVAEDVYGGAYGRPLREATALSERLPPTLRVDPTYSAKALVAAAKSAEKAITVFWMTFDSRWIASA